MVSLSGSSVMITGGAGGLGRAFAEKFLSLNCKVCLCDINVEVGQKLKENLSSVNGTKNVTFVQCDVANEESFRGAFSHCKKTFGGVDVLINNAGIGNEKDFVKTIEINLLGGIRGTELALEAMSKAKGNSGGKIINIASTAGLKDIPFGPFYGASKSGLIHYTRTAGHPFHYSYTGVSIQCLCPSLVETSFIQLTPKTIYNQQCETALKSLFGKIPLLQPEEIATALIQLIEESKPGAVMVVEKGEEPFYVPPSIPTQ